MIAQHFVLNDFRLFVGISFRCIELIFIGKAKYSASLMALPFSTFVMATKTKLVTDHCDRCAYVDRLQPKQIVSRATIQLALS